VAARLRAREIGRMIPREFNLYSPPLSDADHVEEEQLSVRAFSLETILPQLEHYAANWANTVALDTTRTRRGLSSINLITHIVIIPIEVTWPSLKPAVHLEVTRSETHCSRLKRERGKIRSPTPGPHRTPASCVDILERSRQGKASAGLVAGCRKSIMGRHEDAGQRRVALCSRRVRWSFPRKEKRVGEVQLKRIISRHQKCRGQGGRGGREPGDKGREA